MRLQDVEESVMSPTADIIIWEKLETDSEVGWSS